MCDRDWPQILRREGRGGEEGEGKKGESDGRKQEGRMGGRESTSESQLAQVGGGYSDLLSHRSGWSGDQMVLTNQTRK